MTDPADPVTDPLTDSEIAEAWRIWSAHDTVMHPYRVCQEGCRPWPCASRLAADAVLRTRGIDPFAVRRGEGTVAGR